MNCININNFEIPILFEDREIIAVIKPFGLPSQPDKTSDIDLLTIINDYLQKSNNKNNAGLIHRLDRKAGGIIVFSKNDKTLAYFNRLLQSKQIYKYYLTITKGTLEKDKDTLINYLKKNERLNKSYVVENKDKYSKEAILEYEILERVNNLNLLKIKLITGRHHQIRVQLSHINNPVIGDSKYGKAKKGENLALWAYYISFIHPITNKLFELKSYPPSAYPWNLFKIENNI